MDEAKSIALAMLGIVAVLAVVGLVLMFSGGNNAAGAYTFSNDIGSSETGPGGDNAADRRYSGLENPCGNQPYSGASPGAVQAWLACMQDYQGNRYGYN